MELFFQIVWKDGSLSINTTIRSLWMEPKSRSNGLFFRYLWPNLIMNNVDSSIKREGFCCWWYVSNSLIRHRSFLYCHFRWNSNPYVIDMILISLSTHTKYKHTGTVLCCCAIHFVSVCCSMLMKHANIWFLWSSTCANINLRGMQFRDHLLLAAPSWTYDFD